MRSIKVGLKLLSGIFLILTTIPSAICQIPLLGDNAPHGNIADGNFEMIKGYWRQKKQSPFWKTYCVKGPGEYQMGIHNGTLFCTNEIGVAESVILNTNPDYQTPKAGDVFYWSFGADLEYICDGRISLSIVFGEHERIVADKVKLIGADKKIEHFEGTYTLTEEDAKAGMPFVRFTFYTEDEIKIFLHYVNIGVKSKRFKGPELSASVSEDGILLKWQDPNATKSSRYRIYRQKTENQPFKKLGETADTCFLDKNLITGIEYTYVVTHYDKREWGTSNKVKLAKIDQIPPTAPSGLKAEEFDAEIKISWAPNPENDIESYSLYRIDNERNSLQEIAHNIKKTSYLDFTPQKGVENIYMVVAHDYSGNKSQFSEPLKAKVKMVKGASFSDLILPIPIQKKLSYDTWGGENVLPREINNGIESPEWSYWGGRPVKGKDGKYHMLVTRWPANATKGHWEWPRSTVAYAVAKNPIGPYEVIREHAYEYANGLGHNPDIILLNNGQYLLYSLINWKPTLFISKKMKGPWKRLGTIKVNTNTNLEKPELFYRFERNLSGVQREDGRFLFVTKAGAIMLSKSKDPLGPYEVLTPPLQGNTIIPEKYRNSNFEDPVLWKDEVQYHMIINAFLDFRAIYLRSPDGIHWKFNPGTAYTPNNTIYENGHQTHWYKLERPHVITDEYGRATHLSLAVIDVPKKDDLPNDNHNSKNIILPLIVHKRIKLLNKNRIGPETNSIKILIYSEKDFDAQNDINIESLRFGAPEKVDYGLGCRVIKTTKKGKNLLVEFDGKGNGVTDANFTCKLLGKTKEGELIIAYSKLKAD